MAIMILFSRFPPRDACEMGQRMVVSRVTRHIVVSRRARLAVALTLVCATRAVAQSPATHSILGTVSADSAGAHALGSVVVTIPTLGIATRTNWMGEFRLVAVPPGRWLVVAKHVGYQMATDSVTVGSSDASLDFVRQAAPVTLDSVMTRADVLEYRSPNLRGFVDRMNAHQGGYFIADSVLRRNESRPLANVLESRAPGLELYASGNNVYAMSTRTGGAASQCGVFQHCTLPNGQPVGYSPKVPKACYVSIYVDGVPQFDPAQVSSQHPPTDVNSINVSDLAGVEYYPSPESAPEEYASTSPCGALLLWTREK